jgi:RimJ/RimL family protein N-acetyltransferase
MIGDPTVRGRGIGQAAVRAIMALLTQEGLYDTLYSRYLLQNSGSARLLAKVGFLEDGDSYVDGDGLAFQNVRIEL